MKARRFWQYCSFVSIGILAVLLGLVACDGTSAKPVPGDGEGDEIVTDGDNGGCLWDSDCLQVDYICANNICIPGDGGPCSVSNNPEAECREDAGCSSGRYCSEQTCTCKLIDGDGDADGADGDGGGDWPCDKLPCIQIEPTVLGYGAVQYLEAARNTFNIRNRGGATLDILSMEFSALSSQDFKWADNQAPQLPLHLEPGQAMEFEVELTPTDPGVDQATIQIICNDLSRETGKFDVLLQSEYKGGTYIEVSPIDYNFGPVEMGQSIPLQITIRNLNPDNPAEPDPIPPERNKLLTIQGIQLDPATTIHYRLQENLPPLVYIPPSDSFQFRVFYEPKANGVHDAKVRILHDADRNPYSPDTPAEEVEVDLTGMGVIPCLSIEPDPVDFGKVTIGYQISVPVKLRSVCGGTVRLCGCEWRAPIEPAFTIQDPTDACHAEIPPNGSRTLWIDFLPTSRRFYGAVLKLCSNDSEKPTWLLGVEGEGSEASLHVEPNPILFDRVLVGADETLTFKIINSGTGEVVLQGVQFEYEGPQPGALSPFFLDSGDSALLPLTIPGATPGGDPGEIEMTVHYIPVAQTLGWLDEATMVLSTNNPSQPTYDVTVRGIPVWPICEFSVVNYPDFNGIIDFGEVNLSTSETQKLRITNEGEYVCKVSSVALGPNTSSEFDAFPRLPVDIEPGDYHDIHITYAPVFYTGPDAGSVLIETNDLRPSNQHFEAQLVGVGVNPTICITPDTSMSNPYNFGEILLGCCSDAVEFTLRNCDVGTLEMDCPPEVIGIQGSWIVSPWSVPPLGPCKLRKYSPQTPDEIKFTVQFCPQVYTQTQNLEIRIKSNDINHAVEVVHAKGKGAPCDEHWYNIDTSVCDCEYYCAPNPARPNVPFEICDGYDNNCDGNTDEGFDLGQPCDGVGECGIGIVQCNPADPQQYSTICSTEPGGQEYQAVSDLCDSKDNDCDGRTDEDYKIGDPCIGEGECGVGEWACAPGDIYSRYCDANDSGEPEICDNRDNDCDGQTDNGQFKIANLGDPAPVCNDCLGVICQGQGECDVGYYQCLNKLAYPEITDPNNWVQCSTDPGGASTGGYVEICDDKDNDCDGQTDEGYNIAQPCDGLGECGVGVTICDPDFYLGTICSTDRGGPDYDPAEDVCDGKDNDCDGQTDEDYDLGGICDGVGECGTGEWECKPGDANNRICSTDRGGSEYSGLVDEILCDGKDDDCDGETDENFNIGDPCIGAGACGQGFIECEGLYTTVCSTDLGGSNYLPQPEVCDGFDNNCDHQTDEIFNVGMPCEGKGECGPSFIICSTSTSSCCEGDLGCGLWRGVDELCDSKDNDCDGLTDEYVDGSGTVREIGASCVYPVGICGSEAGVTECNPQNPAMSAVRCSTQPGGSQSLATEEICNGLDDDCNGTVDDPFNVMNGDEFNCGACNRVCTVETNGQQTGTPECLSGQCHIQSCFPGYADVDGSIDTGCECPVDDHDLASRGNACNDARQIGSGSIIDSQALDPINVVGNIASADGGANDSDWFYFQAKDDTDQSLGGRGLRHEQFNTRIALVPSDEFAFEVFLSTAPKDCSISNCNTVVPGMACCHDNNLNSYFWELDGYYTRTPNEATHPPAYKHCAGQKECRETNPTWDEIKTDPGLQSYNLCYDFSKYVMIRVFRRPDSPQKTCRPYTLTVSNGKYTSASQNCAL